MPRLGLLLCGVLLVFIAWGVPSYSETDTTSPTIQAAPLAIPLPGDRLQIPVIHKWLQSGDFDQIQPVNGRSITVIEFWGSWDPLSRVVLPEQDEHQPYFQGKGIKFLTIAEEPSEETQAYLRQAKIEHLAVASDPNGDVLRSLLHTDTELPCPFAVIVEEAASGKGGRILWLGPVLNDADSWARCSGYQDDLDTALERVLAKGFDLSAERAAEKERREFYELVADAQAQALVGHIDEAARLAREMQQCSWPRELNRMHQDACATLAYFFADAALSSAYRALTDGTHTYAALIAVLTDCSRKEHAYAILALELAKTARKLAKKDDAVLLSVYAAAQSACGDFQNAIETQRRAMQAPRPRGQFLQIGWMSESEIASSLKSFEDIMADKFNFKGHTPAVGPATLTADQAVADLNQLKSIIRIYHPAYDDAAWALAAVGSSWDEHTEQFAKRLRSQPEWVSLQFQQALAEEYLGVTADAHTNVLYGFKTETGAMATNVWYATKSHPPFFTELRVQASDGRFTIAETPPNLSEFLGAEIIGVSVIGSPITAEPRQAYFFPTFPSVNADGLKQYLLGFLCEAQYAPRSLTVTVRTTSGQQQLGLPVHRGRGGLDKSKQRPPWTLVKEPTPILEVRTMRPGSLKEMPGTADALRKEPLIILDLRANSGGSDVPARNWCTRLTGRPLDDPGGSCYLRIGESKPLQRWNSFLGDSWMTRVKPVDATRSCEPFDGRVVILTDNGTGSAGEGFTRLASWIPGSIVVGENTAGGAMYGNRTQRFSLAESKFEVRFGCSKGVSTGRPMRDGMGYFPDYWLDSEDPVKAIIEHTSAH